MKKQLTYWTLLLVTLFFKPDAGAQTLAAGDIAFIGYNTDDPDGFSFITLKNLPAGETLYFTEEGWGNGVWGNEFEPHLQWVIPFGITIGTIVSVVETGPNTFTVTGASNGVTLLNPNGSAINFSLSAGDQILAYQSTTGVRPNSPVFISGVHGDYNSAKYNATTTWNTYDVTNGGPESLLPPGLTNGVNAVSLFPAPGPEIDNAKFTGSLTGTASQVRTRINTPGNWSNDDNIAYDITPSSYSGVNVTPDCTNPTITADPSNKTTCSGSNTNFSVTATGVNGYKWQENTGSGFVDITNGGVYSGATTSTLSITGATAGMNGYLYRVVALSGTCSTTSSSATLTVNVSPSISTAPTGQSVCAGGNASFSVVANNASIYTWQVNQGSGYSTLSNGSIYSGQGTATLSVTGVTSGMNGYTYRVIASGSCSPVAVGGPVTLTVNTAPTITQNPFSTSTTCEGDANLFYIAASNATSYKWQVSTDSGDSWSDVSNGSGPSGGIYSGATSSVLIINNAAVAMNGFRYRAVASSNCTPSATSSNATFTVLANVTYYEDFDNDGYGNPEVPTNSCAGVPDGFVANNLDCDDNEGSAYPGATEIAGDGIDNDCDGTVDNPAPTAYAVTGGGVSCSGIGVAIGLANSETGISYQLKLDTTNVGDAVTGTGEALSFGSFTAAGSYTVVATPTLGGQTISMTGSAVVTTSSYIVLVNETAISCAGETVALSASAGSLSNFTGAFAPENWTLSNTNANGTVNTASAPASIAITGGNGVNSGAGTTDYSITLPVSGTLSFNWSYSTTDGAQWDYPQMVYNDATNYLTGYSISGGTLQSSSVTMEVVAGETLVLRMYTVDNTAGAATVVISNFSVASSVTGTPSYVWTASDGGVLAGATDGLTASATTAGTYTLTATVDGCTFSDDVVVTYYDVIEATGTVSNVSCNGGSNGLIDLTASGGTSPYTYLWGGGITTEDRTGLAAGDYSVTITDANGCTAAANFAITQPSAAVSGTTVVTNVSCNGGSNGSIDLTPTGGTAGYTYNWGGGITTQDRTGLSAGSYSVEITDANGCTGLVTVIVTQPSVLSGTVVVTNAACYGLSIGTIDLTPTGGTAGYTYNWGGGITTQDRIGLSAGNYSVEITDANGCTTTVNATVTQPTAISGTTVVTNVSCNGGSDGSIDLTPTGGTAGYTYNWGGGITTEDRTGLSAGNYSVEITDANGCSGIVTVTVTEPSVLSGTVVSQTNVSCKNGSNGGATVLVSGGSGVYTYTWSNGSNVSSISGVPAGTYNLYVVDSNNCGYNSSIGLGTLVASVQITEPSSPVSGVAVVSTPLSASNAQDGALSVTASGGTASGGTAPYTYAWSNGAITATITGLIAGTYTCWVTDANGCVATAEVVLAYVVPAPVAYEVTGGGTACAGGTGVSIGLSGSETGVTYQVQLAFTNVGDAVAGTGEALSLGNFTTAGIYTVLATNTELELTTAMTGNAVVSTLNYIVEIEAETVTCISQTITLTGSIEGSNAPDLSWTASNGGVIDGDTDGLEIEATSSGTYTLTATVDGCMFTKEIVVDFNSFELDETTWNGTAWSNGAPHIGVKAIIDGDLIVSANLEACELVITENGSLTVQSGAYTGVIGKVTNNAAALDFVVENNGVLVQLKNIDNEGPVTVNVNSFPLYRQDYTLWSSPVLNQNLRSFSTQTIFNRFSSYDASLGTVGEYVQEIFTTQDVLTKEFEAANGYLIRMPNNWAEYVDAGTPGVSYEGIFKGVPQNGTITVPLSTANVGMNLVGNPYPSPIIIPAFFGSNPNIEQTIYYWRKRNGATGSGYATYNNMGFVTLQEGLSAIETAIESAPAVNPGQGFFVKSTGATQLTFNNEMRYFQSNGVFLRSATQEKHRFRLNLSSSTALVGQTLIGYVDGASAGVDNGYDSSYFNDSSTALTSLINGTEYIIQGLGLPFDVTSSVSLGFKTDVAGTFSISLGTFDGFFAVDQNIYVKDNLSGQVHNVKESAYSFVTEAGVFNDRFEVVYQNTVLGTDHPNFDGTKVMVYKQDDAIHINTIDAVMQKVELYDVRGSLIQVLEDVNQTTARFSHLNIANQVVLVKITTVDQKVTTKKIVF